MKPTIICLTPVRNEAWILDRFLQTTSLWADYIIIADQMSTDGSREIALKYPKVILVDNLSKEYDEQARQKLLISEARKIEGPRLLITLDADEIFTPNVLESDEWEAMLQSEPGTIFKFQWANICPDFKNFWYGYYFPWGYMDDGHEHTENNKIHSGRVPLPQNHPVVQINDIKVMHFQFTDWKRMESKHRWYQCMEVINYPEKSAIEIYRQYHHMDTIDEKALINIPEAWFRTYCELDIQLNYTAEQEKIWYDEQILNLIIQFKSEKFRKLVIWDIDWVEKGKQWGKHNSKSFADPRNTVDKLIHFWLKYSQNKLNRLKYRRIERMIKKFTNY